MSKKQDRMVYNVQMDGGQIKEMMQVELLAYIPLKEKLKIQLEKCW